MRYRDVGAWLVALAAAGCTGSEAGDGTTDMLKSSAEREPTTVAEAEAASDDNAAFTWAFYQQIADPAENVAFSPYSISTALSMLSAGAAGETQSEIQTALHFSGAGPAFHQSRNALAQALESRNHAASEEREAQSLHSSNDFWMAPTLDAGDAFLDTLARYYGAGVWLADFAADPEAARVRINGKVSDDTGGLIDELIPSGTFNDLTAFVLTNALYFAARWADEFSPESTSTQPFTLADGTETTVPMMQALTHFSYAAAGGAQAVGLPYFGYELEMVVILPEAGPFEAFVEGLDAAWVSGLVDGLHSTWVDLSMPKMEIHSVVPLKNELMAAGVVRAFDPAVAEFGPIDPNVYITDAFHQTTILVDEEGTEAAAATAIVGGTASGPGPDTPVVVLDRPFLFLIRDVETGAILFAGHFARPT